MKNQVPAFKFSCIVRQGVKDGVPYQEEMKLDPESPETWELFRKIMEEEGTSTE